MAQFYHRRRIQWGASRKARRPFFTLRGLKAKTIRRLAEALISIAHPDYRERLSRFARDRYRIH